MSLATTRYDLGNKFNFQRIFMWLYGTGRASVIKTYPHCFALPTYFPQVILMQSAPTDNSIKAGGVGWSSDPWSGNPMPSRCGPSIAQSVPITAELWFRRFFPLSHVTDLLILGSNHRIPRDDHDDDDDDEFLFSSL